MLRLMQTSHEAVIVKKRGRGRPPKSADERNESMRRGELVKVAAQLFRQRGFHGTSTRDIAAAAGMQSGSIFYFFESKEAILHAVMQDGMTQAAVSQNAALQALGARANGVERLSALVRNHLQIMVGGESDFIPVMLYEWRLLSDAQRMEVSAQKDAYEAQWMPVLQALHRTGKLKARPEIARLLIFGALNWTAQWFTEGRGLTLDELTEQALALFIGER
ncbi:MULTISPECIES: TetR/AcrR family transcriptional regulator [Comamonas]|uniref:TetR/AcrR family transcriptional regulator n=1 Tax=Comamonas TaxID=283 RepID=UPI00050F3E0D|nr:TetR/AcrR family transcriptional regulator [Comamonas thiooxydans]KGG82691.1 TetR family transcriptional regulator [Comamonas thiooxydans]KGG92834.1 TetR family transcriptional regulator [Comamonas thiooxydans]KGH03285.1 TetR family transcriptional regulator [Comamonas thiooxydans]KGH08393.1 TetR family transcriptional regulator [Comamonas thiooxydans]TZG07432.1 TetR/AcrR family transcriptional regulator [Comamonas thiooxydans]